MAGADSVRLQNPPLLVLWQSLAGRFSARSNRDKYLITLSFLSIVLALMQILLIDPVQQRLAGSQQQVSTQQTLAAQLNAGLASLVKAQSQDPDAEVRARLEMAQQQQRGLQLALAQEVSGLIPPEQMGRVIERLLANHKRVRLAELRVLPRVLVGADSGAAAQIYRHGIELSLRGSYFDLLHYLQAVESMPQRLYWEKLEFQAGDYPAATLKLRLYTMSLDRDWMTL